MCMCGEGGVTREVLSIHSVQTKQEGELHWMPVMASTGFPRKTHSAESTHLALMRKCMQLVMGYSVELALKECRGQYGQTLGLAMPDWGELPVAPAIARRALLRLYRTTTTQ